MLGIVGGWASLATAGVSHGDNESILHSGICQAKKDTRQAVILDDAAGLSVHPVAVDCVPLL